MIDPKLEPEEIFMRRQEIGLNNSIKMLTEIVDQAKDDNKRIGAIRYMGLVSKEEPGIGNACYDTLENILISEDGIYIKCEAAKALGRIKLEKGLKPLHWILEQNLKDPQIILAALKSIRKIRFTEPEISLYISYLNSEFGTVQKYVQNKLVEIEPEILIKNLLFSLKNDNFSNEHKAQIIKLMGYEISGLTISSDDFSYLRRKYPEMISDLVEYKDPILKEISRVLRQEDRELMDSIIALLSIISDHIKNDIIKLLLTDDFIVKKNVIIIVGKLKLTDAVDSLVDNLDSLYNEVTLASIEALGEIAEISAVPELLSILDIEDISFEYTDIDMKFQVIDAIKNIYLKSNTSSYEYLLDYLDGPNQTIKESVAFILGEIGRAEFSTKLSKILNEKNLDVRKNAIIALGKIGQIESLEDLISILNDESNYWLIKKVSADAIYNIFQKNWYKFKDSKSEMWRSLNKDFGRLIEYLKNSDDEDHKVKIGIIKILETFGDERAISALLTRVNDFHRVVRIHASNAIKRIEESLELEDRN